MFHQHLCQKAYFPKIWKSYVVFYSVLALTISTLYIINQLKSQYRQFIHSGKTEHTWAEAETLYIIIALFSQAPLETYHSQVSRRRWKLWNIPSYVVQWKLAAFPSPSARRAYTIMIFTGLTTVCDDNAPWQSISVSLCRVMNYQLLVS